MAIYMGPPVTEIEMFWVICSVISVNVKPIVSLNSVGLLGDNISKEQTLVPDATVPIIIVLPFLSCVEDIKPKCSKSEFV